MITADATANNLALLHGLLVIDHFSIVFHEGYVAHSKAHEVDRQLKRDQVLKEHQIAH